MKTIILSSSIATIPIIGPMFAEATGIPNPADFILNAGGMGILGWLLYKHIQQHHNSITEVTNNHKAGLESVSKEIHGLRDDIKDELQEGHRILIHALNLGPKDDVKKIRTDSK